MAISRRPVLLYLPLIPYDFLHFFTYPLDFLFAGFPITSYAWLGRIAVTRKLTSLAGGLVCREPDLVCLLPFSPLRCKIVAK
jgi:hypothetical protein